MTIDPHHPHELHISYYSSQTVLLLSIYCSSHHAICLPGLYSLVVYYLPHFVMDSIILHKSKMVVFRVLCICWIYFCNILNIFLRYFMLRMYVSSIHTVCSVSHENFLISLITIMLSVKPYLEEYISFMFPYVAYQVIIGNIFWLSALFAQLWNPFPRGKYFFTLINMCSSY